MHEFFNNLLIPFSISFFRIFSLLFASSFAYPDVRVENKVYGWTASVRTSYAWCSSGNFKINFGEYFLEYRGWCLLTEVAATMYQGNKAVDACSYTSSGTGYSQFEIVEGGPTGFCVRRVDTQCSC